MNKRGTAIATILLAALGALEPAVAQERSSVPVPPAGDRSGADDFDFEFGEWRVHHRVKRPIGSTVWTEFEGTCRTRALIDGSANVEEHTFERPTGVTYGIAIRAYDPKTAEWAIWWIDSRVPHGAMDPPVKGRFENGVGTFYADSTLDGKPIRVQFIWSQITPTSARWEQAYSQDQGRTWETNWIMELQREGEPPGA